MPTPTLQAAPSLQSASQWDPSDSILSIMSDTPAQQAEAPAPEVSSEPAPEPVRQPEKRTADTRQAKTDIPESAIPEGLIPGSSPEPVRQEAPVESDDTDIPEPVEVTQGSQKGKNAWSQIKHEKKELAAKLKAAEQKIKDAEARLSTADQQKPPEMQKLVELQQQLATYEEKLGKLDITQTKSFKTRFDLPLERTFKRGEAMLQKAGLQPQDANQLMRKLVDAPADQVYELLADQPAHVQGALFTQITDISQMVAEREDAISNWKQTSLALREVDTREQEINLSQQIDKDTAEAVQQALKEGNWMYTTGGNMPPEWNQAVAERIDTVKGILRTAKPAELVKWVTEGLTARSLREMLAKENARANQLANELKQRHNLRPRIGGNDSAPRPQAASAQAPRSAESVVSDLFG